MATNDVSTIYQVDQTTGDLINPNRTVINLNREKVLWTGNLGNITDTITIPAADLDGVIELQFTIYNYGNTTTSVADIITVRMDSLTKATTYVGSAQPCSDVLVTAATFGMYVYGIKIVKATDGALTISNAVKGYFTKDGMAYQDRATTTYYELVKITARMPLLLADTYTKAEVDNSAVAVPITWGAITGNAFICTVTNGLMTICGRNDGSAVTILANATFFTVPGYNLGANLTVVYNFWIDYSNGNSYDAHLYNSGNNIICRCSSQVTMKAWLNMLAISFPVIKTT